MKTHLPLFLALLAMVAPCLAGETDSTPPTATESSAWITGPDAAFRQATTSRRPLLINFTGSDWCIWCHYLYEFLESHDDIDAALHDVFVVAKVYVGDENRNKEFFATLPAAAGAPHPAVAFRSSSAESSPTGRGRRRRTRVRARGPTSYGACRRWAPGPRRRVASRSPRRRRPAPQSRCARP